MCISSGSVTNEATALRSVLVIIYLHVVLCLEDDKDNFNEKTLREMQTLRVGCNKAEPKIFIPLQTPFPGARDGQNLIS